MLSTSIPAAGHNAPQPKLMSSFRRFGRHDNFKPIKSSTSSIGSRSFGNITVDCQLLFSKSRWGVLEELPGGIMYLNLNFGLPQNSKLQEATVTITLDEEDTRLQSYKRSPPFRTLHHTGTAVHFTNWYGPQTLRGEKKSVDVTSKTKIVPEANILGYGMGGMGHERITKATKERRWSFSGELGRGKRTGEYTILRWHLKENELEGQSFHNPKIHTAFAFEHSGQPFIMKIEIKGRLQNWHEKLQSKLKFGVDEAREGKVVTLVDFEDYQKFSRGLDGIARGLPWAMEMENLQDIPMEVPESIPGTSFSQIQPIPGAPFSQIQPPQSWPHDFASHPQGLGPAEARPLLQPLLGRTRTMNMESANASQHQGLFPTADDYRRVLSPVSLPRPRDFGHENGKDSSIISATTSVNGTNTAGKLERAHNSTSVNTPVTKEESRSNGAPLVSNVGVKMMLSTLWFALTQLFTNITAYFNLLGDWIVIKNHIRSTRGG